jgi:DNA-binding transcriptional ArsR family regulator
MLRGGPLSVCQIAAVLDAPVSTVSGHLLELRHAGLVDERRQAKWVYYRLTDKERTTAVLAPVLAAIEKDPQVRRDAAAATALQGRSPSALCEAFMP